MQPSCISSKDFECAFCSRRLPGRGSRDQIAKTMSQDDVIQFILTCQH